MPYVDSFRYYDYDDNYLLDYNSEDCDTIALDSTDGEICDDYHRMVTCEVCGRTLIINTSDDSYDNDIIYLSLINISKALFDTFDGIRKEYSLFSMNITTKIKMMSRG